MIRSTNFDAVIFDGDGVVFDSEHLTTHAFIRTMANFGFTFTEEDAEPWIGISTEMMLEEFRRTHGFDRSLEEYTAARDVAYEACCAEVDGPKKLPGIDNLLDWLEKEGKPFAIASSASPRKLVFNLERTRLTARFPITVTGDQVPRGKPAPDIFLEAARQLGHKAERCVVLEDSLAGLRGAIDAGAMAVAIEGSHAPTELAKLTPYVFKTPQDWLATVNPNFSQTSSRDGSE